MYADGTEVPHALTPADLIADDQWWQDNAGVRKVALPLSEALAWAMRDLDTAMRELDNAPFRLTIGARGILTRLREVREAALAVARGDE